MSRSGGGAGGVLGIGAGIAIGAGVGLALGNLALGISQRIVILDNLHCHSASSISINRLAKGRMSGAGYSRRKPCPRIANGTGDAPTA